MSHNLDGTERLPPAARELLEELDKAGFGIGIVAYPVREKIRLFIETGGAGVQPRLATRVREHTWELGDRILCRSQWITSGPNK